MIKKAKLFIVWTIICAVFITLFFQILFGFDIWSPARWNHVSKSIVNGFSGLVFGVSLLASIPLFIASAALVLKDGKLPFKIFAKKKPVDNKPGDDPAKKIEFPRSMPAEMFGQYIRLASGNITGGTDFLLRRDEAFQTQIADAPETFMPLPDSFDAPANGTAAQAAPTFTEVSF